MLSQVFADVLFKDKAEDINSQIVSRVLVDIYYILQKSVLGG